MLSKLTLGEMPTDPGLEWMWINMIFVSSETAILLSVYNELRVDHGDMTMIKVREVMTPSPLAVEETASLYEARNLMGGNRVRHLPVVDADGELVGIFTQRDLLACTVSILADVDQEIQDELEQGISVREVMTTNVSSVEEDSDVVDAADYFLEYNHGCLPVFSGDDLVGILTEVDFIKLGRRLLSR